MLRGDIFNSSSSFFEETLYPVVFYLLPIKRQAEQKQLKDKNIETTFQNNQNNVMWGHFFIILETVFLAAIKALYETMSVGLLVGVLVSWSV